MPIDLIGLELLHRADYMREPIRYSCENVILPVTCIPNAGLPLNVDGQDVYSLAAEPMARELASFVEEFGVNVVGAAVALLPSTSSGW